MSTPRRPLVHVVADEFIATAAHRANGRQESECEREARHVIRARRARLYHARFRRRQPECRLRHRPVEYQPDVTPAALLPPAGAMSPSHARRCRLMIKEVEASEKTPPADGAINLSDKAILPRCCQTRVVCRECFALRKERVEKPSSIVVPRCRRRRKHARHRYYACACGGGARPRWRIRHDFRRRIPRTLVA